MTDFDTDITHQQLRELLAATALGSATSEESAVIRAHLASCPTCRSELGSLEQGVTALGYATVIEPAPAHLRSRIMDAIAADAAPASGHAAPDAADPGSGPVDLGRFRRARRIAMPVLAAACLVLVLVTVDARRDAAGLRDDLDSSERAITAARDEASRAKETPFVTDQVVDISTTGPLAPAHGNVAMQGDQMVIVLRGMPDPSSGHVWQAWLKHRDPDAPPTSLGTMEQSSGLTVLPLDGVDTSSLESLIITLEPTGGSTEPTGPTDATAQFV